MSLKICFLFVSLSLTVVYINALSAGIAGLIGAGSGTQCENEGGVCFSSNQCCSPMECVFSSGAYGHCTKDDSRRHGNARKCNSDKDCPPMTCCFSERIGFRGILHKSCRSLSSCDDQFEMPADDAENEWMTLKKRRSN